MGAGGLLLRRGGERQGATAPNASWRVVSGVQYIIAYRKFTIKRSNERIKRRRDISIDQVKRVS
jgi:hypothetical protein